LKIRALGGRGKLWGSGTDGSCLTTQQYVDFRPKKGWRGHAPARNGGGSRYKAATRGGRQVENLKDVKLFRARLYFNDSRSLGGEFPR